MVLSQAVHRAVEAISNAVPKNRWLYVAIALLCYGLLLFAAWVAPEHYAEINLDAAYAGPLEMFPFGADGRGRPLLDYATQGARVVTFPALVAGILVSMFAILGGLLRCLGSANVNGWIQGFSEIVGALPRMVVVLVVALMMPRDMRGLLPLAVTWAVLAAPGAMDEASAVAGRLGGARFVEALRAHGYSMKRIYLYHVIGLNLRPIIVRQGAEVMMQVVFLEIALSYLAIDQSQPSFTHPDSLRSWADLLYLGYSSVVFSGVPTMHALVLGLSLVGFVAVTSLAIARGVRAR